MNKNNESMDALKTRADEILFDAMAFSTMEERDAFVEHACRNDAALQQEVAHLFALFGPADSFFADTTPTCISPEDFIEAISRITGDMPESR